MKIFSKFKDYTEMLEEILGSLDYHDTEAVELSYHLYQSACRGNFTIAEILAEHSEREAEDSQRITELVHSDIKDTTLDSIYREVFIDEPLKYQQEVFQYLMDSKRFKKASAEVLAMNFYSPIYFLLQKYDGKENELEMAKHELIQIMNDFCDRCEV